LVPAGVRTLVGAIVAASANYAAVGSASGFIRLEGPGLPEGPETLAIGAMGGNSVTGIQAGSAAKYYPLGVPVTPGNEVLVFGEMAGADVGQISFVVTLIFE